MKYLSDQLINELYEDKNVMMTLCDRIKAQKIIRDYFIRVHNKAVEATEIAKNKREYITPNFHD